MGIEIERKFLVRGDGWRGLGETVSIRQGYLCLDPDRVVRIRAEGDRGFITIKGATHGMSRAEFNYEIPRADADAMLDSLALKPLVEKNRTRISFEGHIWEVDEFLGDNEGLVLAEVELASEGEALMLPEWVGADVTLDPRYVNANLVRRPFRTWRIEL